MGDEGWLKALNGARDRMKFWGNDMPLCPHCGATYDISKHDHWKLYVDREAFRKFQAGRSHTLEVHGFG